MTVLRDKSIIELCSSEGRSSNWEPMIHPFIPNQIKTRTVEVAEQFTGIPVAKEQKILSYGLSSAGYDVRLEPKYKIFTNINSEIIDPLIPSDSTFVDREGESVIIPPNSYLLGLTKEYFVLPRDVIILAVGKSTLARVGAIVNVTPIEPGFCGRVVIEIANTTPLPLRIHADMGVAQFIFFKMDGECDVSYADRSGKYQNQNSIVTAKV